MARQGIPEAIRIAVYNAMGGWGPYTARQIEELFRTFGFTESTDVVDIGGVRRSTADAYQACINWADPDQRRRYLSLVEDVLGEYPTVEGKDPPEARAIRRALRLANVTLPSDGATSVPPSGDDLWAPDSPRVFISHLASAAGEVHNLATLLHRFGFTCFVAHDAIEPTRAWQKEIERALASCEVLLAYLTPRFAESQWTEQEVGWALGRGAIAVPVAIDGEVPIGFLGAYQAVPHRTGDSAAGLARQVFRAAADASFRNQSALSAAVAPRLAMMACEALRRSTSSETAALFGHVVAGIPPQVWTEEMRGAAQEALADNAHLRGSGGGRAPEVVDRIRSVVSE